MIPFLHLIVSPKIINSALNGESALIEEILDDQDQGHIGPSINSLAGGGSFRLERPECGLPKTQDMWLNAGDLAYLTDLEIELIRDGIGLNVSPGQKSLLQTTSSHTTPPPVRGFQPW
jgi:hypothetical protein